MYFHTAFPVIAAGCAVLMDLRTMKVDNGWLLFCTLFGLLMQITESGIQGLGFWCTGLGFPIILLGALFWFRMLGAGDIKLLSVIGGMIGPYKILHCIWYSALIGAGISVAILILTGNIRQRIYCLILFFQEFRETGERKPYYRKGLHLENFHFTVPIFLSVLLYAGGVY